MHVGVLLVHETDCYAIAVYITSYLSKLDKAENANYRLILRDLAGELRRVANGEVAGTQLGVSL